MNLHAHLQRTVVPAKPRRRTKTWAMVRREWEEDEAMRQADEQAEKMERLRDQDDMDYKEC
jgi:hypothetical protein